MIWFFRDLFDTSGFPPRWHCGQWSDAHGWLHILSDIAIFGAYAAIPLVLAYFIRRRKDVPFVPIFWLFAAFIVSCGFTHLIEATIFWHPWYRLSGLMKAVTAVVSWMTVIALLKIIPSALALPGLAKINRDLSEEMTERQKAEEKLRESEERFRAIADNIPQLAWLADAEPRVVWFNQAWLNYTGTTLEDNVGEGWKRVHHPDHLGAVAEKFERHLREGKDWEDTYPLRRHDGEYRWFLSRMKVIRDEAGKAMRFFGTNTDITEQRQSEEALRESEARYRAVVEGQSEMVCRFRLDGTILFANGAYARAVGASKERLEGSDFWSLIPVADRPAVKTMLEGLTPDAPEVRIENRFETKGGLRWILWTNRGLRFDAGGRLLEAQSAGIDITDRKRAEETMARLAALVESSDDGLFGQDLNGIITSWNRGAEQIFGYRPDEIVGTPIMRLIPAEGEGQAQERELQRKIAAGERVGNFETMRQAKDGRQFPVSITVSPLKDGDGKVIGASKVVRDISAHKAAEATALTAHRRLQNVLGSITDGLVVLDKDWRYTYCSEQAARIIGMKAADLLGGCLWDLFPAAEGTKFHEGYHRAVATGQKVEFEEYYPEPINKWLECHCYPSDEGLSVYFHDVTARKQAEEEMRASNQRTLLATEATGVGIWEWNVLTGEIRWDAQMFRLYGITPTADGFVQYSTWSQTVLFEDLQEQEAILQDTVRRAGHSSRAFRIRRQNDGECRHLEAVETVRTNAQGQTEWVIGTNLDVTERKAAEEVRKQNEALFSTLIEQAPLGVYVVDAQFRMRQVNSLAEPAFGTLRPLIGRDFTEVLETQWGREVGGDVARIFRHTLETGERYISPPFVHPRADLGVEQAYDWETQRVTLPDGRHGVVCYFVDVTEKHRVEKAVLAAKQAAEAANQAKDRFLAVLSHELRTPLTPVLMTVGMLEHDASLSPEVRKEMATMKRNIQLETKLIDDLLDVSRITSGKVVLKPEPLDLNQAVRQACGVCEPQSREQNVAVELALCAETVVVRADPARLQQVLWNVLKNAIKFSAAQGTVYVSTTRLAADRVEVRVRDRGIGIAPELLPRIFDAFEQGDPAITRQFGGLGLGLAISKALVELHGGTIRAESPGRGRGATFVIEFAAVSAAAGSAPPVALPGRPPAPLRLLVVEDHVNTARTLRMLLTKEGHAVRIATGVAHALELARQETFDLFVTDLGLPDGTGYDVLAGLKKIQPLTGIVMSGYGMEEDLRRSHEAGFAEHIIKPFEVPQLLTAIQRAAGRTT